MSDKEHERLSRRARNDPLRSFMLRMQSFLPTNSNGFLGVALHLHPVLSLFSGCKQKKQKQKRRSSMPTECMHTCIQT